MGVRPRAAEINASRYDARPQWEDDHAARGGEGARFGGAERHVRYGQAS